jgi:hypothetical protein
MANLRKRTLAVQNMFSQAVQSIKNGRKDLRKRTLAVQNMFSQAVQSIKNGRKEMEAEFIRVVSSP